MNNLKVAKSLKTVSCIGLTIIGALVFLFALVSGSESFGGGFMGVVKNSPNALPWAFLLVLTWLAWKRELIGGTIIAVLGIAMIVFFNSGANFYPTVFVMTVLIFLFGTLLVLSHLFRNKAKS